MTDAIKLLDGDVDVERYAWFAPRTAGDWLGPSASLLEAARPELTQLGKIYTTEEEQAHVAETADALRSWTKLCSECLLPHRISEFAQASRQLCIDCGFGQM